jgi:hypothetical protein
VWVFSLAQDFDGRPRVFTERHYKAMCGDNCDIVVGILLG